MDHRTLEEQGIDLEAQRKIGPEKTAVGQIRLAEHQALALRNGERLLQDPRMVLIALSQQQSTFTHQDIARFVYRYTGNADQFTAVFEQIKVHPELVWVGIDDQQRERFTVRSLLAI